MSLHRRIKLPPSKIGPVLFSICRIGTCCESFHGIYPVMLHCDDAHAEVIASAVEEKSPDVLFTVLHLN